MGKIPIQAKITAIGQKTGSNMKNQFRTGPDWFYG